MIIRFHGLCRSFFRLTILTISKSRYQNLTMSDNEEDKVMVSDQEDNVESDDSDMDDDEGDEIDTAKLSEIDERIRQNPFDYQAHVDKIALLKAAGELVIIFFKQMLFFLWRVQLRENAISLAQI